MNVTEQLKAWFSREVLEGEDVGLDESTQLLELGLMDSMTIVKLQQFVASQFGVELSHKQLTPRNLSTISAIAETIAAQRSSAA